MTTHRIEHLTPLEKSLLITLKGRALDSTARSSFLHDDLAAELADRLDHDLGTVSLGLGVREGIVIRTSKIGRASCRERAATTAARDALGTTSRRAPRDGTAGQS